MIVITSKVETLKVQRSLNWRDFTIINLIQCQERNGAKSWIFLALSSNPFYVKESFLMVFFFIKFLLERR
jgi:hypothetical protein